MIFDLTFFGVARTPEDCSRPQESLRAVMHESGTFVRFTQAGANLFLKQGSVG